MADSVRDFATGSDQIGDEPPVHVEGGSTPAPTSAAQSDDPDAALKAEIRGQSRRDNFGEVRPLAPEEG